MQKSHLEQIAITRNRPVDSRAILLPSGSLAVLATLAVLAALLPAARADETKGDAATGKVYANAACASCHAVEPGAESSPGIGAPPFAAMIVKARLTPAQIEGWLTSSHANMPDLAVPADKRADLIAYIESLMLKP